MPRGNRSTYRRDLVIAEFDRLTEYQKEHPDFVIMPSDMARTLGVAHTTVRRHLQRAGLWTKAHHDAAMRETLRRINESKAKRGYPSLARQRETGFENLKRGRAKLAKIHSRGTEVLDHEAAETRPETELKAAANA